MCSGERQAGDDVDGHIYISKPSHYVASFKHFQLLSGILAFVSD